LDKDVENAFAGLVAFDLGELQGDAVAAGGDSDEVAVRALALILVDVLKLGAGHVVAPANEAAFADRRTGSRQHLRG
jgi:hypothetical protein